MRFPVRASVSSALSSVKGSAPKRLETSLLDNHEPARIRVFSCKFKTQDASLRGQTRDEDWFIAPLEDDSYRDRDHAVLFAWGLPDSGSDRIALCKNRHADGV